MIDRYPPQLQALHSELLDRARQASLAGLVDREGSLAAKQVAGRTYWYFRKRIGQRIVERYLGPDSEELSRQLERLREEASDAKAAARNRLALVRLLRGAGYPAPDAATGKVLAALAAAGVFRLRAVLVGTHAFRCYAALLGVRLPLQAAFTSDVDLAQFSTISLAMGDRIEPSFEEALAQAGRFAPLPSLGSTPQASAWSNADRSLAVELLTPLVGPDRDGLVELPALGAFAQPLRFLDYLLHDAEPAVLLQGSGVLVNVPSPERFACHKLLVSSARPVGARDKARKDLEQAAALIAVLSEDRPEELAGAWEELIGRGAKWRTLAERGRGRLPAGLAATLSP